LPKTIDEAKTTLASLEKRVAEANHINIDNGDLGLKQLLELNLKLREDLSRSFDSYIRLLSTADKIQRENAQLKLKK
jgi:hypothetical protein